MNASIHVPASTSSLWGALLIAAQLALGTGSLLAMDRPAAPATPTANDTCVCQTEGAIVVPN